MWRKIADRKHWYDESFDWQGAACYELALGGPRGGVRHIVYVGETKNEKSRIAKYARSGSHKSRIIDQHLRDGWCLYYRAQIKRSKNEAVAMQNSLLKRFDYDWNMILNDEA